MIMTLELADSGRFGAPADTAAVRGIVLGTHA